jgi:hypothetical protein
MGTEGAEFNSTASIKSSAEFNAIPSLLSLAKRTSTMMAVKVLSEILSAR